MKRQGEVLLKLVACKEKDVRPGQRWWQIVGAGAGAVLACSCNVRAQGAAGNVSQLVQAFCKAEQDYDAPALSRLISERFVEVSPAGEIDAHDRFLSFYTPDKKTEWPPYTLEEASIRILGDTAIDIVTFHYSMPGPDGHSRVMDIRSTFVAQKTGGVWKLIQTQHTGVRPAPPAAAK